MQYIKRASFAQKAAAAFMIFGLLAAIVGYYVSPGRNIGPRVYVFDEKKHMQPVVDIFNADHYWLTTNPEYSPEFMLKYRACEQNIAAVGRLNIRVLQDGDQIVGFTAFFFNSPGIAQILFVAVKKELRGRHYGEILVRNDIKELKSLGAQKIWLLTRVENISAQTLYKRVGFVETKRDGECVYYGYMQ